MPSAFKLFNKSFACTKSYSYKALNVICNNPIKVFGLSVLCSFGTYYFVDQSFENSKLNSTNYNYDSNSTKRVSNESCNLTTSHVFYL